MSTTIKSIKKAYDLVLEIGHLKGLLIQLEPHHDQLLEALDIRKEDLQKELNEVEKSIKQMESVLEVENDKIKGRTT